jgi:hypothetical protein
MAQVGGGFIEADDFGPEAGFGPGACGAGSLGQDRLPAMIVFSPALCFDKK